MPDEEKSKMDQSSDLCNHANFPDNCEQCKFSQDEIKEGLMNETDQENKPATVTEDYFKAMKSGTEVFSELSRDGKEEVEKGIEQRDPAWTQASNNIEEFYGSFNGSENDPDEQLEEKYLKYIEPQSSKFYLGKLLTSLNSLASRDGFFNARNNKEFKELDPKIDFTIKMIERFRQIQKKLTDQKEVLENFKKHSLFCKEDKEPYWNQSPKLNDKSLVDHPIGNIYIGELIRKLS